MRASAITAPEGSFTIPEIVPAYRQTGRNSGERITANLNHAGDLQGSFILLPPLTRLLGGFSPRPSSRAWLSYSFVQWTFATSACRSTSCASGTSLRYGLIAP